MNSIEIRILSQAPSSPSPDSGASGSSGENAMQPDSNMEKAIVGSAKGPTSSAQTAAHYITKEVLTTVNSSAAYYLGKYETISEDYHTQEFLDNASSIISRTGNIAASTITGARILGPAGAIIGAAIGVIKQWASIKHAYNDAIAQLQQSAYSNYYQGVRAGTVSNGRDTNE